VTQHTIERRAFVVWDLHVFTSIHVHFGVQ
jgi:hypothetical protein